MSAGRWALAVGFTMLALVPFAIPDAALPNVPVIAERAVHVCTFALGAFVWTLVAPRSWGWVAAAGLVLSGATEMVQDCCIEGRGGEWGDLGADVLGLVLGLGLAAAVIAVRRQIRTRAANPPGAS